MWNDKTTVVSRTAIVSFVRTEIQSRHASSAARFPGPYVSRDARTVSKKIQRERKREREREQKKEKEDSSSERLGMPNFFINAASRFSFFRLKLEEEHRLRQAREQAALREEEERRRAVRNSAPAAPVPAPAPASADTAGERVAPPPTAFH